MLVGDSGNDTFSLGIEGGSKDIIDGGSGIDTASYISFYGGVVSVDLEDSRNNGGDAKEDVFRSVEAFIGTTTMMLF
jgi:Ca2+-binding RTX toxin-like protein